MAVEYRGVSSEPSVLPNQTRSRVRGGGRRASRVSFCWKKIFQKKTRWPRGSEGKFFFPILIYTPSPPAHRSFLLLFTRAPFFLTNFLFLSSFTFFVVCCSLELFFAVEVDGLQFKGVWVWMWVCLWVCARACERERECARSCVSCVCYMCLCLYLIALYTHTHTHTRVVGYSIIQHT